MNTVVRDTILDLDRTNLDVTERENHTIDDDFLRMDMVHILVGSELSIAGIFELTCCHVRVLSYCAARGRQTKRCTMR